MGAFINLSGVRFGLLTAVGRMPGSKLPNGTTRVKWLCACDCGGSCVVSASDLRTGHTQSCGCVQRQKLRDRNTTHGLGKPNSYRTWANMIQRCENPKVRSYKDYGAKGVKVCEAWKKFENFYADMGDKPEGGSIDRIDVEGDYKPSNCRWATTKEQARNTRKNINIEHNGKTMCLVDWAAEVGIPWTTLYARLTRLGWDAHDALTVPVDKRKGPRPKA